MDQSLRVRAIQVLGALLFVQVSAACTADHPAGDSLPANPTEARADLESKSFSRVLDVDAATADVRIECPVVENALCEVALTAFISAFDAAGDQVPLDGRDAVRLRWFGTERVADATWHLDENLAVDAEDEPEGLLLGPEVRKVEQTWLRQVRPGTQVIEFRLSDDTAATVHIDGEVSATTVCHPALTWNGSACVCPSGGYFNGERCVTCFAPGTPIYTPAGAVAIEDVRPGDTVWSFDAAAESVTRGRVLERWQRDDREYGRVRFGDGTELSVTPEHPFFSIERGEYVAARELDYGSHVLRMSAGQMWSDPGAIALQPLEVVGADFADTQRGTVYNLRIERFENYFAGGVLVHNY